MNNLQWKAQRFQHLSTDQWFEVLKLRVDVFVVEQACAYPELEEFDRHSEARHLTGYNKSSQLIAYARLLPAGLRYPEINLGRFVVRADSRRQGIGHELLQASIKEISDCWRNVPIKISAQEYLQRFYSRYGFIRVSEVYLEDGIPHVEMVKEAE